MKKENLIVIILSIFLLFVAAMSIKKASNNQNKNQNNINYQQTEEQSTPASMAASKNMNKPEMTIDQNKSYQATMHTSEGDIVIELDVKDTPITVNNFVYLAKSDFYNNTIFHRVIKGFMIQGGDPNGDGTGGPGYQFDDEDFTGEYTRGTIAMANAGPNTNGSQFFIMHQDYGLQPNYVIFGHVVSGMDVVNKIANAEVTTSFSGERSKPVKPVTLNSVEIEEK